MAKAGDSFTVTLMETHLDWGEYRNPTNREPISGEGYIPIPKEMARKYDIFNSNNSHTGFGYNLFTANSSDGFLNNVVLLAQGSSKAGDVYAKQFSVQDNLKLIGQWYTYMGATVGDKVKVTFTSSTEVLLEII